MSSNFSFLQSEWPEIHASAAKAEAFALPDPGTACFHARRTLELVMHWLFRADARLTAPYQNNLSAMVHEPTFVAVAGAALQTKARLIVQYGNAAVHTGSRPVTKDNAVAAVRELFHVSFWLARHYSRGTPPPDTVTFLPLLLPASSPIPPATKAKLQELERTLAARAEEDAKKDAARTAEIAALRQAQAEALAALTESHRVADADSEAQHRAALDAAKSAQNKLEAELAELRLAIAEARRRNAGTPDTHDYNEAETRDAFIDLLLREAGWPLDRAEDREYEVRGMPSESGAGFVDYVLWGSDGRPLAVVEAKRTRRSAQVGQQQAKLYADALEQKFGRRPAIFLTNGYQHWLWDDVLYPPRQVSGFLTRDELELLHQRRAVDGSGRKPLLGESINPAIVERGYQERAIRKVAERFERDRQRRALLVMATGSGKTRTAIALVDLLMRAGWVKRVLFLADRVALVKQAVREFTKHLPASAPVNLVTDKYGSGRVYLSTYPTMMGLIDERRDDGTRRFGTGHFDLVIVDEAHRSIYQKYSAIFDYFDSLLLGLTATPRDEIDRNTYRLFALEDGVPTDEYSLHNAVEDKYLVPAVPLSVPLQFQREGIRYADLSAEEREEWESLEWNEEGDVPTEVSAAELNTWLFNKDTVDKVLQHLMTRGHHVAGGDRIGKTIVFAKNHRHAEFIAGRFDANYPHLAGHFCRVIDFSVPYAQSLIDSFSRPEKAPHIAVSVDMLDTGIDVPEVVNLVFFKTVRSKTKFWQMVGRGTRLCKDLFGPGRDKKDFRMFDFCQNLEFFSQEPAAAEGTVGESLARRLFVNRLELIEALDGRAARQASGDAERALRDDAAARLHREVAAMTLENFLVRPHRRLVERFSQAEAWQSLCEDDRAALAADVAGLPSGLPAETPEAKQFDLLLLRMQLTLLRGESGFAAMRESVETIARLLEMQTAIPSVAAKLNLLQQLQTQPWWDEVTVGELERVRRDLRDLVQFIERRRRAEVITDFEDRMGDAELISLPGVSVGVDLEKVRAKAMVFLRKYADDPVLHKLRFNEPLASEDLATLERIFLAEGATPAELESARQQAEGLGLFVRSIVGMDRQAAHAAFNAFRVKQRMNANQIEFVDLIVNHLASRGFIDTARLYESPFTDTHPFGLEGVFPSGLGDDLLATLERIRFNAGTGVH